MKEKISLDEVYSGELIHEIAENCKYAFRKKKQEAADIGTEAHQHIEGIIRTSLSSPPDVNRQFHRLEILDVCEGPVLQCVNAAVEFLESSKVVPLYAERRIYSRRRRFSGTADLIARIEGRLALLDWKSSKGLYPEYNLQTAAYVKAYEEETGERVDVRYLIRLGKEDGAFEVKELPYRYQLEADYQAFLVAKKLYDWQQNNKK